MSVFRIEFQTITPQAQRGMAEMGAASDRLTGQLTKMAKAAVDVQEQTLRVEAAQGRAAKATEKYGADSLKAAKANTALARAVVGTAAAQERLDAATKANAAGYATMANRLGSAGGVLTSVGHALTGTSVAIDALGFASGKMAVDFNEGMERIHTQAGASQREVDALRGRVLELARTLPQGPTALEGGLYHLESIGLRDARAMDALRIAALGAAVGNSDLEDTASALGGAWLTNIKGAGDLLHTMGLLNATVGAGNMRMGDLVQALGTGILPAAKIAGLGIKDVLGALAVFTDENIQGSSATAQLATSLHFLYSPTTKAASAMQMIGLGTDQLAIDMRKPNGLLLALTDLHDHLAGLSKVQQEQILGDILPGGRGRILLVLLNQLDRYQQKLQQIGHTSSQFGEDVTRTQETPLYRLQTAWSSIRVSMIDLGDHVLPAAVPAFHDLADVVDRTVGAFEHLPHGLQSTIVIGGVATAALAPVAIAAGAAVRGLGTLTRAYGTVIAWSERTVAANQAVAASETEIAATADAAAVAASRVTSTSATGALILPAGARTVAAGEVAAAESAAGLSVGTIARGAVGVGARVMRGAGLAAVGATGSQLLGTALGGHTGHVVGGVGTGAAIGAGLGSIIGPEGTVAGAIAGGLVGLFHTIGTDYGEKIADAASKGITSEIRNAFHKRIVDAADAAHRADEAAKPKVRITAAGVSIRLPSAADIARANAAQTRLGATLASQWEALWNKTQFHSTDVLEGQFMSQVSALRAKLSPLARDAAARSMIEFAHGLEQNGRLPKGATDKLIADLEATYPGLASYLRQAGENSNRTLAQTFRTHAVYEAARAQVRQVESEFDWLRPIIRTRGGSMQQDWLLTMQALENATRSGTRQMRAAAASELAQMIALAQTQGPQFAYWLQTPTQHAAENMVTALDQVAGEFGIDLGKVSSTAGHFLTALSTPKGAANIGKTLGAFAGALLHRDGGLIRRFQDGGLVPAFVSSGEQVVYEGMSWTVPGSHVAADNVFAMLPEGAAVLTAHGQQLAAGGMPLGQVLAAQAPHFATGGVVKKSVGWTPVGATVYDDPSPGAFGSLAHGFAELGTATRGGRATGRGWLARAFGLPGELPAHAAIDFALGNRVVTLTKQDRGYGQGGNGTTSDPRYAADLWRDSWSTLGIDGSWKGTLLARPHKGSVSGLSTFSYLQAPAVAHPRLVDILQPYGAVDAFQQGFAFASTAGNSGRMFGHLFVTPTGMDSSLFMSAISGVRPNTRDLATRVSAIGTGANLGSVAKNVRSFDGYPVANWIVPILSWARGHGWRGAVTSGYRTPAQQMAAAERYGLSKYGSGGPLASNHTKTTYPGGAVDVTSASQLTKVLRGYHSVPKLVWGGPVIGDPVHFSATGHRRGGIIGAAARAKPTPHGPSLGDLLHVIGGASSSSTAVVDAMRGFAVTIEDAQRVAYGRLDRVDHSIRDEIRGLARGGLTGTERVQVRRLRGTLTIVEGEMGKRIGDIAATAQTIIDAVGRRQTSISRHLAIAGVDEGSLQGLTDLLGGDTVGLRDLAKQHGRLEVALRRARAARDPQAVQSLKDQIGSLDDTIDDMRVDRAQKQRALDHARRYDPINAQLALDQLSGDTVAQQRDYGQIRDQLTADLQDARRRGDYQAIQDLVGRLEQVNSSLNDLQQAQQDMTAALRDASDQLRTKNELAQQINSIATGQAMRALADVISGQIAGTGYAPRSQSAGDGTLARY